MCNKCKNKKIFICHVIGMSNEYSILALALLKDDPLKYESTREKWHSNVMTYMEDLRQMSNSLRF